MRCRTAQYAIHLDREGECPPRLRKRALEHASSCVACGEELRRVASSAETLARIRAALPRLSEPAALTSAVMRELERPNNRGSHASVAWPLSLFPSPRIRMLLQSAAWTIAILFAGQTLLDADSMSELDERFARQSAGIGRSANAAGIFVSRDPRMAQNLSAFGRAAGLSLEALVTGTGTPPAAPPAALDRLREKYPDLWTISLEDGLDEKERQTLLTQGPALLKDLEQLITRGRTRQ